MVEGTLSIRMLTTCQKSSWHLFVGTSCSSRQGLEHPSSAEISSKLLLKMLAPAVPHLLTMIMLVFKLWQAIQFTGELTETKNTTWASLSQKTTFSVVFPGVVCTAEPVEKYLKACSDQAATRQRQRRLCAAQAEIKFFLLVLFSKN